MTLTPTSTSATAQTRVSPEDLLEMYRRMYLIRRFEESAGKLYRDGKIPGFVHLAIGQEASAVGACFHLRKNDVITSTHRGHGHALSKGLTPEEMFAELMGKETGVCRGRGGSMHIADPSRGIFGANGIVGAGIPIALGAATAEKLRGTDGVAVAFLGDGAISTGAFHESANVASLKEMPMVLFCENNRFSEFSSFEDQHPVEIEQRAIGYGLRYRKVDGNDVLAVSNVMAEVLSEVRTGGRPYLIEAVTLRGRGHYEGDPQLYRADSSHSVRDPLDIGREHLASRGIPAEKIVKLEAEVEEELEMAITAALEAPLPDASTLTEGMLAIRERVAPLVEAPPVDAPAEKQWKTFQAVAAALRDEMREDPDVFIAGIDVGKGGNVFGITRGFAEEFGERIIDTPIAESAIIGMANGAAMAGLKPVVEIMYFDFIGVCLDQIMNQAAKLPFMTGGRTHLPLTIRTQFGAGRASGAQHSQSLEAMLAHIPGLTVLMPSTPADAYGMLRTAIQDPNPVIFVENRLQYGMKGEVCDPSYRVPIGQAALRSRGDDLTIVTYSRMVQTCTQALAELNARGVQADLIDLRTIAPLDVSTVLESVSRTNRLLIVHEATSHFGVGAEIAARVADEGVWYLDAPIVRVGAEPVPAPYSSPLEQAWLPSVQRIVDAAIRVLDA